MANPSIPPIASAAPMFFPRKTALQGPSSFLAFVVYAIRNVQPVQTIYMILVHTLALVALLHLRDAQPYTLALALVLAVFSGLGITGGAHRLWSHRSYKAHWTLRTFLMLCNTMAHQRDIAWWSREHRCHHRYSGTNKDPHNDSRGLFYSHVGWMLIWPHPECVEAVANTDITDILADPVVKFQIKCEPLGPFIMSYAVPTMIAHYGWGEAPWVAFLVAGILRFVLVLNATFCVNSVAHRFGSRPYSPNHNSCENWFVAVFAIGEGWHNFHHRYPFDYSASEVGWVGCFNPTTFFLDTCAKVGLVSDRRKATSAMPSKED